MEDVGSRLTAHEGRRQNGKDEEVEGTGEVKLESAELLVAELLLHGVEHFH